MKEVNPCSGYSASFASYTETKEVLPAEAQRLHLHWRAYTEAEREGPRHVSPSSSKGRTAVLERKEPADKRSIYPMREPFGAGA